MSAIQDTTRPTYPPRAGPEHNSARAAVLRTLVAHASKGVQLRPAPWSVPALSFSTQHAAASAGDTVWKQINGMRIMAQYCHSLGEMCSKNQFLQGHPITSVKGLEW